MCECEDTFMVFDEPNPLPCAKCGRRIPDERNIERAEMKEAGVLVLERE
jgi:hypothetical protein